MPKNVYKPKNSRKYYLRVSVGGKPFRESLQTTSQRVAEKLAKARIRGLKAEAEAGVNGWLFHNGFMEFNELLEADGDHGWSSTTRRRYRTSLIQIGRVLANMLAEKDLEIEDLAAWEITKTEVAEFVSMRKDAGKSIATINRDLTAFAHLMTAMKNKGWIEANPVREFERQGMRESLPDIIMPSNDGIGRLAE